MDEKSRQLNKKIYNLSRIAIRFLAKIFFIKVNLKILENIPESGPAVIVASHKHWLDIPLLCHINKRNIHYIAKEELFKNKITKCYFESAGVISIKRGQNDREAIAQIVEIIKRGEIIAIYPEGTRFKDDGIGELNNGIAIMLLRNRIYPPIYPVVLTYQKGKFLGLPLKVNAVIGEKINTEKFSKVDALMEEIRYHLNDLYEKSKKI